MPALQKATSVGDRILLTVEEASYLSGFSRATIYREIASSRLEAVKLGRATRIRRTALDTWIEALESSQEDVGNVA